MDPCKVGIGNPCLFGLPKVLTVAHVRQAFVYALVTVVMSSCGE